MQLLRVSLAVLFGSFTLWAQVPGSDQKAPAQLPVRIDTSAFSLANPGLFAATSQSQALPLPDSRAAAPAGDETLKLEAAAPFRLEAAACPWLGSEAAMAQQTPTRPKAFTYSDAYLVRRKIHMYASFATVPLFVAQTIVGQQLYNDNGSESLGGTHSALAASIAVLFAANTVTGVWNLWEASKDPNGRTKRLVHGILMLIADAGFVATGALAPDEEEGLGRSAGSGRSTHRTVALVSMGIATAGYLYMLIAK